MVKSRVQARIEKLEKARSIGDKCDWFTMFVGSFGYSFRMVKAQWLIELSFKVKPEHESSHVGLFSSLREAREWSLEDLKSRHPDAYEKLVKSISIEGLLEEEVFSPLWSPPLPPSFEDCKRA